MPHLHQLTSLAACLFLVISAYGQQQVSDIQVSQTYAVRLGTTPPLSTLMNAAPTDPDKKEIYERSYKEIDNFFNREIRPAGENSFTKSGPDPLWQKNLEKNLQFQVVPEVNIDGLNSSISGSTPPDPAGDIGSNYYVQVVNSTYIQFYEKDGTEVGTPINANTIWNQVGFTSAGDPIILYDQENDQWIMTEFPPNNRLLVAVSEPGNPFGMWTAYAFSTPNFPDYPKYAIWKDAIVVTTNESGTSAQPVYLINRAELMSAQPMVTIQRISVPGIPGGPGFQVSTPVDWTGPNPPPVDALPMVVRLNDSDWGEASQDRIEVYEIDVDFADVNNTTLIQTDVNSMPFDLFPCAAPGPGFSCIPQPDGSGIDGLPEVIMHQTHYRNFDSHESMVMNFITDADGNDLSGIRWVEMRRTPGNPWSIYQEGTYAPADGNHRFMGGIAMDGAGNIGLAYSVSGPNTFPGLRFTGRRASDPLGTMTVDEYVVVDGLSNSPSTRYGDYAAMSVDPVDDRTFWYTGEYRRQNGWGTGIVAFSLGRDTVDIGPSASSSPVDAPLLSAAETVQAQFKNFGIDTVQNFEVGFIMENGTPVVEPVSFTLYPDSLYTHTFGSTVDLSVIGAYELKIFSSLSEDTNPLNDTLRSVVTHQSRFDAGVTGFSDLDGIICGDSIDLMIEFTNFGADTLTSVSINYQLNADAAQEVSWTGSLAMGEAGSVTVNFSGLLENNVITAYTFDPDGMNDEVVSNDTLSRSFDAIIDADFLVLELLTDNYPNETTWELTDLSGAVLYTGGPYDGMPQTLITESLCVEAGGCYTFTIFDSYGDGIQFGGVEGFYTIFDGSGTQIAGIMEVDFGFQESNAFCLPADCNINSNVSVTNVTEMGASNGVILLVPTSGVPPFLFSINGGASFQGNGGFVGLEMGTYNVIIRDSNGCEFTQEVIVDLVTAIEDPETGQSFEILPNPNNGRFRINLRGLAFEEVFLPLEIYDANGRLVHRTHITRYDDTYTGEVSLIREASGVYLIRFNHPDVKRMIRVIKN